MDRLVKWDQPWAGLDRLLPSRLSPGRMVGVLGANPACNGIPPSGQSGNFDRPCSGPNKEHGFRTHKIGHAYICNQFPDFGHSALQWIWHRLLR